MLELFKAFPKLRRSLPYHQLGEFPTPVIQLTGLEKALGKSGIYCKQDGLSATPYGGNKIRKLEFLLGDALRLGVPEVVTFGCVGSNHALATAINVQKIGKNCTLVLFPQPNARAVRQNLLLDYYYGAEMVFCRDFASVNFETLEGVPGRKQPTDGCYSIPSGGSSAVGAVGYVNAAFELKAQIDAGLLPEPDYIILPMGTMGTAAGLMLGCKAVGLHSKIIPVRVIDSSLANETNCTHLFNRTSEYLHSHDRHFPLSTLKNEECRINQNFFGTEYARYTSESIAAVKRLKETDAVRLEGTYSGKAMAAFIDFCIKKENAGTNILFWNTYNAHDLSEKIVNADYRKLHKDFWWYFENEVQELDR